MYITKLQYFSRLSYSRYIINYNKNISPIQFCKLFISLCIYYIYILNINKKAHMNLVKVVIPIYQASLSQQERKSLSQAYKILRMYPLVVIKPNHLDLSELVTEFPKLSFISFADSYFKGISGYNRLMLAKEFYESFLDCTYILIYQLDAYVFRDELREWCNKGYDYIGAPWLQRPVYKLPVISGIMHLIHSYHKFRGKPSKQDLYGKIGNGGLSLRKVASHYRITCEQNERIDHYLAQKRYHLYNEDVFWATEANGFTYPKVKEAIRFSFDKYPGYCYKLNNRQLPFGCHSWYKRKMKKFWMDFIPFQ